MYDVQASFKGRVYGPILLEVSVQDAQHARYLEQLCASAHILLCLAFLQYLRLDTVKLAQAQLACHLHDVALRDALLRGRANPG